jgi:hypothetical protein
MKYVRTTGFLIDLRRLPEEHRKLFVRAVNEVLRPALDAGAHTAAVSWPRALRVHRSFSRYPDLGLAWPICFHDFLHLRLTVA